MRKALPLMAIAGLSLSLLGTAVPAQADTAFHEFIPVAPQGRVGLETHASAPTGLIFSSTRTPVAVDKSEGGVSLQFHFRDKRELSTFKFAIKGIRSASLVTSGFEGRQVNAPDGGYLMVAGAPEILGRDAAVQQYAEDGKIAWNVPKEVVFPITIQASYGWQLIESVGRSSWNGDVRYLIKPTAWGRTAPSATHAGWGWPEAQRKGVDRPTRGLHEQYVCHPSSQLARLKSTWNVERARPTVGLPATIAAGCNPGGGND